MSARERLPNRRNSTTFSFVCGPHRYVARIAFFPAQIGWPRFSSAIADSDIDAAAKDSAVVAGIALQHGASVDEIRKALLRDAQGNASSLPFTSPTAGR
jgi:hypothetical protein